jgi:hypothetical protein
MSLELMQDKKMVKFVKVLRNEESEDFELVGLYSNG